LKKESGYGARNIVADHVLFRLRSLESAFSQSLDYIFPDPNILCGGTTKNLHGTTRPARTKL